MLGAGGRSRKEWGVIVIMGAEFQLENVKKFWGWMVMVMAEQCE